MNNTTSNAALAAPYAQSRITPLVFAGLLGLFVVGFAGFAQTEVLHNAGHDARHSLAFPCH